MGPLQLNSSRRVGLLPNRFISSFLSSLLTLSLLINSVAVLLSRSSLILFLRNDLSNFIAEKERSQVDDVTGSVKATCIHFNKFGNAILVSNC